MRWKHRSGCHRYGCPSLRVDKLWYLIPCHCRQHCPTKSVHSRHRSDYQRTGHRVCVHNQQQVIIQASFRCTKMRKLRLLGRKIALKNRIYKHTGIRENGKQLLQQCQWIRCHILCPRHRYDRPQDDLRVNSTFHSVSLYSTFNARFN